MPERFELLVMPPAKFFRQNGVLLDGKAPHVLCEVALRKDCQSLLRRAIRISAQLSDRCASHATRESRMLPEPR
jgi:hypothetical protein